MRATLSAGSGTGEGRIVARVGDLSGEATFSVGGPESVRVDEGPESPSFDLSAVVQRARNRLRPTAEEGWAAENGRYTAGFDADWMEAHPLTLFDLRQESQALAAIGLKFRISGPPVA